MRDRKRQPLWLKALNFLAVIILAIVVFSVHRTSTNLSMTEILALLFLFSAIALINFIIQFGDILKDHRQRKAQKQNAFEALHGQNSKDVGKVSNDDVDDDEAEEDIDFEAEKRRLIRHR